MQAKQTPIVYSDGFDRISKANRSEYNGIESNGIDLISSQSVDTLHIEVSSID